MPNTKKQIKRKKRKPIQNENSNSAYIKKLFTGSLISVISFFVLTFVMSLAVVKIGVGDSLQTIAMFLFSVLSTFIGAFFSLMKTREKGLVWGFLSSLPAIIFICIVLLIALKDIGVKTIVMSLLMMLGGTLGGIAAVNKR